VPHSSDEALDPRTHLPVLTQERAPLQTADLPTERTESSIPRDAAGNWDYPSPQQFYNALVRKGFPTPENEVETMVQIHNFLNEAAWDEVQKWEAQENKCVFVFFFPLHFDLRWITRLTNVCVWFGRDERLQLVRFKGRPGELSPKARFFLFAGWLLPSRFKYVFFLGCIGPSATAVTDIVALPRSDEPPFDRHDWIVRRGSTGEEVRYVIDYYGAPPLPDGSPVFSLDVRPALDNVSSISMRVRAATRSAWEKVVPETSHA
jgi:cytochrome c heme-lyase